jgi:hypothetical protein
MKEVIAKILSNSNGSQIIPQKKHTEFGVLSLRVNDVDLPSNQFIQDLEVLCAMKNFLKNTNF